jgi:protein-S-isoprenylcysteine O-methyltransferase Ste14
MSDDAAHKNYWQTADAVFGLPFLAGIALQFIFPLSLPRGPFHPIFVLTGGALALAGLIFITLARREMAKLKQPTDPGQPTSELVTRGVFAISRNPMYLGVTSFLAGVAVTVNLPWGLILLPPSLIICHYVLIAPEERYLTAKFSDDYTRYTHAVHRWIGHKRTL